uniref:Uncharacterized protein n=1 Tax=Colobus angolensis palliatus TaxID=336983 RepID=A0A2K5HJV6_COLAP
PHGNFHLLHSSDSPAPASRLIFIFLVESRFRPVGQAGLELLTSSDPPSWITGVSRRARPHLYFQRYNFTVHRNSRTTSQDEGNSPIFIYTHNPKCVLGPPGPSWGNKDCRACE